jgi:hypothetical protein
MLVVQQYLRLISGAAGVAALFLTSPAIAQNSTQVRTLTKPQIEAIQSEKAARTPAQQKLSSQILDTLKETRTGAVLNAAPDLKAPQLPATDDGVTVDIKADVSAEVLGAIEQLGGRIINNFPESRAIRASLPLENIESLAERSDVQFIKPAVRAHTNVVAREGDIAHMADIVQLNFNVRGAGVKIGVISNSIDDGYGALDAAYASGAIARGKLSVLPGQEGGPTDSGEGLAMAQIIHAIAPEAELIFATGDGGGGPEVMRANILELARRGCQIIVDDLTYPDESPFQDGPISLAVNQVSEAGVLYFSSARNSGSAKHGTSGTWEGDFRDGGPAGAQFGAAGPNGRVHVFTGGITLNTVTQARPGDHVNLFWADPLGASTNSYDIFIVNPAGNVVRSATTSHTGTQDPYQTVDRLRTGESIVIVKEGGSADRFLHLDTGRAILRYGTTGSVRGHNASGAENAFSVAAKRVPVPPAGFNLGPNDPVESFSSDGPRRVFFAPDGRPLTSGNYSSSGGVLLQKPDITAANGVSTTFPPNSPFNPFNGTSAAAPHAAAIAALLLSCTPKPAPAQVRLALQDSAVPIESGGPNVNAGYGIIMAHTAAESLCQLGRIPAPSAAAGQP